ncbi:hypothetical protein FSP39_003760 [Pinctada imbricata]|uniref:Choline O-acetyltransferase n=1 Tax=Pinctada imbricata TaxID=66713 RepID=A0AA89BSH5_PINIB|nr:hypothetical protein FSP39_003760 [Pinctada imbricata]
MTTKHVREYVKRVASIDQEQYPTWDISKPLPKLPIPDLNKTLTKYIDIIQPILDPPQYAKTKDIVKKFGGKGGEGEKLQEQLIKFSKSMDNWAYGWWLDEMYMKIRLPLPINSNPGMVFPKQLFTDHRDQLRYAARLISGILDYKTVIDARGLPVDRARHNKKGQPMCMEQYYRLFTSYRIPGIKKDALASNNSKLIPDPEHIIVICKNQFFVLDVIINFTRLSEDDLFTQLNRITKMASDISEEPEAVGILTAAYRDKWAVARGKLMEESTNRDSMDAIERCIFVLCLDQRIPILYNHRNSIDETSMNVRDDVSLALQMLHGLGTESQQCKSLVRQNYAIHHIRRTGPCGLNYEHSPSEGIAVVQLIEHLLKYMEEVRRKLIRMQSVCELPAPRKLQWKITSEIKTDIAQASENINKQIDDLDVYILRFERFGREFPKAQNMSPDSFIQLALQLTYYKIHGKLVSTYESASTRRFHLGRVDNIRANSPAALEWIKTMVGEVETTDEEKMVLLRKAMQYQTDIMTQTILGHGIDCHMMGLRNIAMEMDLPIPEVFLDDSYIKSNHFTMSTSQVPTTMDAFMLYGPVVPDGYGCCYNPHPNSILVCISSFKSHSETRSDYFGFTLEGSFLQMHELCLKTSEPPPERVTPRVRSVERNGSLHNQKERNGSLSPRKSRLVRQKQTDHPHPEQNG